MPKLDLKNMIGCVELDGVTWYQNKNKSSIFNAIVNGSFVSKPMWLDNGYVVHKTANGYEAVEILPVPDIDDEESRLGLRNALDHLASGKDALVVQLKRLEGLLQAPALCDYLSYGELGVENTTNFTSEMGADLRNTSEDLKGMINALEIAMFIKTNQCWWSL